MPAKQPAAPPPLTEDDLVAAQAAVTQAEAALAAALAARGRATTTAHTQGMSLYRIAQLYGVRRQAVYDDLKRNPPEPG